MEAVGDLNIRGRRPVPHRSHRPPRLEFWPNDEMARIFLTFQPAFERAHEVGAVLQDQRPDAALVLTAP